MLGAACLARGRQDVFGRSGLGGTDAQVHGVATVIWLAVAGCTFRDDLDDVETSSESTHNRSEDDRPVVVQLPGITADPIRTQYPFEQSVHQAGQVLGPAGETLTAPRASLVSV